MALFAAVEVDGVDFVDDFAQLHTVFHEVFGVHEDVAHDALAQRGLFVDAQVFQGGHQFGVDEMEQVVAGEGVAVFVVGRPVLPLVGGRDDGLVVFIDDCPVFFFVAVDFEEEQPGHLLNALRIAVDAGIGTHDVLDGFDEGVEAHRG